MRTLAIVVLATLVAGCAGRTPKASQSADATHESAQRQQAEAGQNVTQIEATQSTQSQEQQSETAGVAPVARDVGAMTVTASAEYHDMGQHQFELEIKREAQQSRYAVGIALSVLGLIIIFSADNICKRWFEASIYRAVGLAMVIGPWVPMLFMNGHGP